MAEKQELWQEYLQEYNSNLQNAKQHVDSVINDNTATQEEKNKARSDYVKQLSYYNILQNVYDASVESGTFPDTFDIDSNNKGSYSGIYRISGDDKIYMSSVTPCNYEEVCAVSEHFSVFWKVYVEEGGNIIDLPDFRPESVTVYPGYGQDGQGFFAGWVYDSANIFYMWVQTKDNNNFFKTTRQQIDIPSGTNMSFFAGHIFTDSSIPTFTQGQSIYRTSMFGGQGLSIALPEGAVSTNNPWDYYNDNILPDIAPENAAFPDGYQPGTPKPDPDFPELPGEEEHGGDNIEPNDTTGIGGGFGFMTQYALRAADIQELGKKLWAGFDPNDPNVDNYLRNFIYKISTTTGSVNFADIMDFFVSLRFYPCPLGNISGITTAGNDLYVGAGTEPIVITNIIHTMNSYEGVLNAGTLTLPFWYGDFRDFQTQITLYLPYCGTAELNPVDVMGGTLECFYEIDFCTGGCTGYVWVTTWEGARYCVASLPGQLGADVPMSATNAGRVASRIMGDRITFTENLVSILRHGAGFAGAAASGNMGSAVDRAFSAFITPTISEEKRLNDELGKGAISAPVLGSGGGFATYKNPSTAYIQVRSAFYPDITNYPDTVGNPASETVVIGDCTGFCRFVNVDVTSITADIREQTAIRHALENGVIL